MTYSRQYMVTTRAFISSVSRTVIAHPSLIKPALSLYNASRARQKRGIASLLPSRRYLSFRLYTQYGHEPIASDVLRDDVSKYLTWLKETT